MEPANQKEGEPGEKGSPHPQDEGTIPDPWRGYFRTRILRMCSVLIHSAMCSISRSVPTAMHPAVQSTLVLAGPSYPGEGRGHRSRSR